jgi:hypothetical protein
LGNVDFKASMVGSVASGCDTVMYNGRSHVGDRQIV